MQYLIGFMFFLVCFVVALLCYHRHPMRTRANKAVIAGIFYSLLCMCGLYIATPLFGKKVVTTQYIPLRAFSSGDAGEVFALEIPITSDSSHYIVQADQGGAAVLVLVLDDSATISKEKRKDAVVERMRYSYVGLAARMGFAPSIPKDRLRIPEGAIKIPAELSMLK